MNLQHLAVKTHNMMANVGYVYSNQDVLSHLRFVKYEVFHGSGLEFTKFMAPILSDKVCGNRLNALFPYVFDPTYRKPQKV